MEHLTHPSPHFSDAKMARFVLRAFIIALGGMVDNCSISYCPRLSVREITLAPQFPKCFPSTRKRKAGVFKPLRFEVRFPKAPLDSKRPNRRNNASINSSGAHPPRATARHLLTLSVPGATPGHLTHVFSKDG